MQDTVKVHVWNEHLAKTFAHVILAYLVHPGMRLALAPCFKAF